MTELHYKTMGIFTLNIKSSFSPSLTSPLFYQLLPIWDVFAKLFETVIKITTQTYWRTKSAIELYKICSLVHTLWKNIIMTFTSFQKYFLHYLDMISTVKRNCVDESFNFPSYSCFFPYFCFALLTQTYNSRPDYIKDIS